MNSIELQNVSKYFKVNGRRLKVVDGVSFRLEQGRSLALIGPSGCGKSTILSMTAGFFPPDEGRISVSGSLGLCLQDDKLLPWRTVLKNACLPGEIKGAEALAEAKEKASAYLPLFGLDGFEDSYPAQLSGGMRQRAALLRTLIAGGDFMLLDEPFARLDALTKEDLHRLLHRVMERFSPGMLLITHDIEEALKIADEICLLSPRPARVVERLTTPKGEGMPFDPLKHAALKQHMRDVLLAHKTPV